MNRPRIVSVAVMACALAVDSRASEPTGREATNDFAKNLASFPSYICRYTVTTAEAGTIEEAQAGRWSGRTVLYYQQCFDHGKEFWSARQTPFDGLPARASGPIGSGEFKYLSDGRLGLADNMGVHQAWNLFTPEFPYEPDDPAPLTLGQSRRGRTVGSPDTLLVDPNVALVDEGLRTEAGRLVHVLRYTREVKLQGRGDHQEVRSFHLDPARGYLPVYQAFTTSTHPGAIPIAQIYLTDIRACPGGRWFPMRTLKITDMRSTGQRFRVAEMLVSDLDVETPPVGELFRIDFPGECPVYCNLDLRGRARIPAGATVTPADLTDIHGSWEASVPPPTGLELLRGRLGGWRWWYAGSLGGIAVMGVFGVWWRFKRKRAGTGDLLRQ